MIRPLALRTAALTLPFALTLAAAALAPHAQAQTQTQSGQSDPVADMLRARGERYHRAPDSAQNPDEVRRTQALNAEIVAQNDLAESEDRANAAAYAKTQATYQAQLEAAEADRIRHKSDLNTAAQAQADYERRMADWRATVAACERGDRARCNAGRQAPN